MEEQGDIINHIDIDVLTFIALGKIVNLDIIGLIIDLMHKLKYYLIIKEKPKCFILEYYTGDGKLACENATTMPIGTFSQIFSDFPKIDLENINDVIIYLRVGDIEIKNYTIIEELLNELEQIKDKSSFKFTFFSSKCPRKLRKYREKIDNDFKTSMLFLNPITFDKLSMNIENLFAITVQRDQEGIWSVHYSSMNKGKLLRKNFAKVKNCYVET
jgi:hypothetical protein